MTVACGNRKAHPNLPFPMQPHHETVSQVKLCFAREGGVDSLEEVADEAEQHEAYLNEPDADALYERHLENLGWEESYIQDQMEAQMGVVQFDDAMRDAEFAATLRAEADFAAQISGTVASITPAEVFAAKPILDGTYTVERPGVAYRTFRLRTQASDNKFMPGKQIIAYLSGSDNKKNYIGFGNLEGARLRIWAKHRGDAALIEDANFLISDIEGALKAIPCARCHDLLTVPDSIRQGFGPVCVTKGIR